MILRTNVNDREDKVHWYIDTTQWLHVLVVGLMTLILDWVYLIGCSFVFNTPTRASLGRLLSRVFHISKSCGNSLETFSEKLCSLKWFLSQNPRKASQERFLLVYLVFTCYWRQICYIQLSKPSPKLRSWAPLLVHDATVRISMQN